MLPARFRTNISAIANDRKSGAIELALRVVDSFIGLSQSRFAPGKNEVQAVSRYLSKAQPSMASVHNAAELCTRIFVTAEDASIRLEKFRSFLKRSNELVSQHALGFFAQGTRCITLSRSSTVLTVLKLAARSGRLDELVVMESRPMFEGRVTARELAREGVSCIVVVDALGPSKISDVDFAIIGSDAVLNDGAVINKVGSRPLSMSCMIEKKPLYVITQSIKLDRRYDSYSWPGPELRGDAEVLPRRYKGIEAENRYFDLTPTANVHSVVHEGGISRRSWERQMQKILEKEVTKSK